MKTTTVFESIGLTEYSLNDSGVIENVPVLGAKSRNKRVYTTECMQNSFSLYEEAAVYVDHSSRSRRSDDKLGLIKNARFDEETNQIRGDLHLLESHPLYTRIQEDVSKKLNLFGLSHSAEVWAQKKEDITEITKIEKVNSVDLVSTPATLKSLTESEEDTRADYLETVREEAVQLINEVITESLVETLKTKIKEVVEELSKERITELSANPYNKENQQATNEDIRFILPTDKAAARKAVLSL